jgi:hypothetical protein
MVQRIHRPEHELDVPLRVDIIQGLPSCLPHILNIHFFIHHYDALAEHRLPQSPRSHASLSARDLGIASGWKPG